MYTYVCSARVKLLDNGTTKRNRYLLEQLDIVLIYAVSIVMRLPRRVRRSSSTGGALRLLRNGTVRSRYQASRYRTLGSTQSGIARFNADENFASPPRTGTMTWICRISTKLIKFVPNMRHISANISMEVFLFPPAVTCSGVPRI